ncbi:MAG TPA: hypothetical protein VN736_24790 [Candidatus Limnocylindrales bacterium]|nr:hypothetical protein [Candidatus Limnocylindrales bacterium]
MAPNINVDTPRNSIVLAYLTRLHRDRVPLPVVVRPEEVDDAYMRLGAHPEVVQRIWDELGKALPRDCRRVVYSTPALVHPENGTIFALALGTGYGLRLPPPLVEVAIRRGARTSMSYTDGNDMNTHRDLGRDWVLGAWLGAEPRWCTKAFEYFGRL